MKKLLTVLITLTALAGLAAAQTVTYTAPVGASACSHVSPYQQWYQNLVENSTPPYPGVLEPNNFQMPAFPNHPLSTPVTNICGGYVGEFVSPDSLFKANLQIGGATGNLGGWFRISSTDPSNPNSQAIQLGSGIWTLPDHYPSLGESVPFAFDATVLAVCTAECHNASGTFHVEGQWAFQWAHYVGFRWNNIVKLWQSTTPLVVTIVDQSTVAILD